MPRDVTELPLQIPGNVAEQHPHAHRGPLQGVRICADAPLDGHKAHFGGVHDKGKHEFVDHARVCLGIEIGRHGVVGDGVVNAFPQCASRDKVVVFVLDAEAGDTQATKRGSEHAHARDPVGPVCENDLELVIEGAVVGGNPPPFRCEGGICVQVPRCWVEEGRERVGGNDTAIRRGKVLTAACGQGKVSTRQAPVALTRPVLEGVAARAPRLLVPLDVSVLTEALVANAAAGGRGGAAATARAAAGAAARGRGAGAP